jgi:hypothetical protein
MPMCALVLALARTAEGAPPSARDLARTLADAGYELYQEGKFADAVIKFEAAEAAFHAPTNLLFLARSKARLGRQVAALALYRRLAAEQLPADAAAAFQRAQLEATAELHELEPRVPRVRVVVRGAPPDKPPHVDLDGMAIAPAGLADAVPIDPGEHTISVSLEGATGKSQHLTLAEGSAQEVVFDFTPGAATPGPTAPPVAAPPPPSPPPPAKGSLVPAIATFAVAAMGIGVGAATGVVALGKMNMLRAACPKNPCSPANEGLANDVKAFANASTAGFVIGGAAAAVGIVLAIVRPGGGKSARAQEIVRVHVAPSWLRAEVAF